MERLEVNLPVYWSLSAKTALVREAARLCPALATLSLVGYGRTGLSPEDLRNFDDCGNGGSEGKERAELGKVLAAWLQDKPAGLRLRFHEAGEPKHDCRLHRVLPRYVAPSSSSLLRFFTYPLAL